MQEVTVLLMIEIKVEASLTLARGVLCTHSHASFLLVSPQIHANCRIRRIYFSDRLYSEEELPPEFKLFLPVQKQAQEVLTQALPVPQKPQVEVEAAA